MGESMITDTNIGRVDDTSLMTVSQKLARGSDLANFKTTQVAPEKIAAIESLIKKGMGLHAIARETHSSTNTIAVIRDRLIEREPTLFKAHMSASLQRLANKTATTIERGIDEMENQEIKPTQLVGLSVALGIILDKAALLNGDSPTTVVEHRLTIDTAAVNELIAKSRRSDDQIIDVTHSMAAT